ncbi:MAG: leucine-rich repeat protein [Clostridia bacterium]|nr:leucine-rich repeat protein [Clostridia bacterium]
MSKLFLDIFNLSITASWLILAVLAVRLLFRKRVPKWVNCVMWGIVGLRLLIPFTLESPFSLSVNREVINTDAVYGEAPTDTVPPTDDVVVPPADDAGGETQEQPNVDNNTQKPDNTPELYPENTQDKVYIQSGIDVLDDRLNPVINGTVSSVTPSEEPPLRKLVSIASYIWLAGTVILLAYAVINYFLLKYRVSSAIPFENSIRKSERVDTPFVLGFFRPRIYLPFGLSPETEESVVAHENAHIRRNDHIVKPLGYAILAVYWFNPLVWVAYILLCRDIESACDEKVIKEMDTKARQAYATALLECSVAKSTIAACPLAFGEIGVKYRVKNTMRYKKPAMWIIISAVVVCVLVSVLFLTSPDKAKDTNGSDETSENVSETVSENDTEIASNPATDFEYEVNEAENGIIIIKYIGTSEDVVIPAEIDSLPVVSIQGVPPEPGRAYQIGAFEGSNIKTVVLPASITVIGDAAFSKCADLKEIKLPDSLTELGNAAFRECKSLKTIEIPAGIKVLRNTTLAQSGFETVILNEGLEIIDVGAFNNTKISEITFPSTVKQLGDGAFLGCERLTKVVFNDGLESIGRAVFCAAPITEISIPASAKTMDERALEGSYVEKVYFQGDAPENFSTVATKQDMKYYDFTVYYYEGAKGFTSPEWCGYKCQKVGEALPDEQPAVNQLRTYFPDEFFELSRLNTGKAEFDITVAHSDSNDRVPGYVNFIDTDAIAQNWKLTVTVSENIRCFAFIEVNESVAHKIGKVLYVHDTTSANGALMIHTYINDVSANRGLCYITGDGEVVYYSFGCNMNTGEVGYGKDVYNLGSVSVGIYRPDITGTEIKRENHDIFGQYFNNFLSDAYRTEWTYVGVTEGKYNDPSNKGYTEFDVYRVVYNGREDYYAVPYDDTRIEAVYKFQFDDTMIPVWIKPEA